MIQWGDLLRVPYTGYIRGVFGLSLLYGVGLHFCTQQCYVYSFETLYICISLCFVFICRCLVVRFSEIVVRLGPGSIVRS